MAETRSLSLFAVVTFTLGMFSSTTANECTDNLKAKFPEQTKDMQLEGKSGWWIHEFQNVADAYFYYECEDGKTPVRTKCGFVRSKDMASPTYRYNPGDAHEFCPALKGINYVVDCENKFAGKEGKCRLASCYPLKIGLGMNTEDAYRNNKQDAEKIAKAKKLTAGKTVAGSCKTTDETKTCNEQLKTLGYVGTSDAGAWTKGSSDRQDCEWSAEIFYSCREGKIFAEKCRVNIEAGQHEFCPGVYVNMPGTTWQYAMAKLLNSNVGKQEFGIGVEECLVTCERGANHRMVVKTHRKDDYLSDPALKRLKHEPFEKNKTVKNCDGK